MSAREHVVGSLGRNVARISLSLVPIKNTMYILSSIEILLYTRTFPANPRACQVAIHWRLFARLPSDHSDYVKVTTCVTSELQYLRLQSDSICYFAKESVISTK